MEDVFKSVNSNEAHVGVVPIESTNHGMHHGTLQVC